MRRQSERSDPSPLRKRSKVTETARLKQGRKQEPSSSRLTERQLAVARLVSSYKYECKKMMQSIAERQKKWKRELEGTPSLYTSNMGPSNLASADAPEPFSSTDAEPATQPPSAEGGVPWTKAERDVLKRCFLAFGFDRWEEVEDAVRFVQPANRRTREEMRDACYECMAEIEDNLEGEELAFLANKLDPIRHRLPIHTPGYPWRNVHKFQATGKSWVRTLQFVESVRTVHEQLQSAEKKAMVKESLYQIHDHYLPALWWTPDMDFMLIACAYTHGQGVHEILRSDGKFCRMYKRSCLELELRKDSKFKKEKQHYIQDWPESEKITLRLRKVTEVLLAVLSRQNKETPSLDQGRQQKLSLVKSLMAFGLPQEFPDPISNTQAQHRYVTDMGTLLRNAGLAEMSVQDGRNLCQELMTEMESLVSTISPERREGAAESAEILTSGIEGVTRSESMVLVPYSAACLKERLEMLRMLKSHISLVKRPDVTELLRSHSQDMPPWWVSGVHDYELLAGVMSHGFGSWRLIFQNSSLSFSHCISLFVKTQKTIAPKLNSLTAASMAAEQWVIKLAAEAGIQLSGEDLTEETLPTAQWLTARCKLLYTMIKQHVESAVAVRDQPEWLARLNASSAIYRGQYPSQPSPVQNLTFRPTTLSVRPGVMGAQQPRAVLMLNSTQGFSASLQQLQQQLRPGFALAVRPYAPFPVRESPDDAVITRPQAPTEALFNSQTPQIILAPQSTQSVSIPPPPTSFPPSPGS